MDNSKFFKTVIAVLEKQQAALKKLAQGTTAPINPEPPPQAGLGDSAKSTKRTVDVINENLPANLKMGGPLVTRMEVDERHDLLKVQLTPAGKAKAQGVMNALTKAVSDMQSTNKVVRMNPLNVQFV